MSDFAGTEYEFAAGSLFGLRGWNMDEMGRLHGVTHREVWRPGENTSVCKQESQAPCPQVNKREEARRASEAGRAQVASKKKRGKKSAYDDAWTLHTSVASFTVPISCGDPGCVNGEYHLVGSTHAFDPTCQCGFWAYDEAGFKPHGKVIGVIEGYGKTTVGTKGFRCEKARIVGLSELNSGDDRLSRSALTRLASLYPDAAHYADVAALTAAFPDVLHVWPEVDEAFWLKPVPPDEALSSAWRALSRSMLSPFSYSTFGGVV